MGGKVGKHRIGCNFLAIVVLGSGIAFADDTTEEKLSVAKQLQTHLTRMNCYRSGIDGVWGLGSRRAMQEYISELEGVEPDLAAELDTMPTRENLEVVQYNDVACSSPVAAAPRRTTSSSSRPATTTRRAKPAPAPTADFRPQRMMDCPGPACPADSQRTPDDSNQMGAGVFR